MLYRGNAKNRPARDWRATIKNITMHVIYTVGFFALGCEWVG